MPRIALPRAPADVVAAAPPCDELAAAAGRSVAGRPLEELLDNESCCAQSVQLSRRRPRQSERVDRRGGATGDGAADEQLSTDCSRAHRMASAGSSAASASSGAGAGVGAWRVLESGALCVRVDDRGGVECWIDERRVLRCRHGFTASQVEAHPPTAARATTLPPLARRPSSRRCTRAHCSPP